MAWLPGYAYRKPLVLTGGASGAQTDFQLDIDIAHVAAKMQADFDDIRFTQNDGTTLIDAWLESKVDSTSAETWAEFPTTPANTVEQTYYMYYGNAEVASDWGGAATFEFFDDGDGHSDGDGLIATGGWVERQTFNGNGINEYSNDRAYSGGISLHLEDKGGEISHSSDLTELPQVIESMMYIESANLGTIRQYFSLRDTSSSWSYAISGAVVAHGTVWKLGYGGVDTHASSKSLTAGWHKITLEAAADGSAKVYIDNDELNIAIPIGTIGNEDNLVGYGTYSANHHTYMDEIRVRKYAANPPTYAFGAEESAPTGGVRPPRAFYGPFAGLFGGPIQ